MTPKCIVVLGMHRSATSLISKGLSLAGIQMGERILVSDRGNPGGYYEDLDFVEMNKKIFKIFSREWFDPPSRTQISSLIENKLLCYEVKNLIERNHNFGRNWGWKDPRTAITIPFYDRFLPDDTIFVVCMRSPKKIAESLVIRNGFNMDKGLSLAKEYNQRILEYLQSKNA